MSQVLCLLAGIMLGRWSWFMRKMRQLNVAEARARSKAEAAAKAIAHAEGGSVVVAMHPLEVPRYDGHPAVARTDRPGVLADVPSVVRSLGPRGAVVHGWQEVIDVVEDPAS